jgi:hypothetical protein
MTIASNVENADSVGTEIEIELQAGDVIFRENGEKVTVAAASVTFSPGDLNNIDSDYDGLNDESRIDEEIAIENLELSFEVQQELAYLELLLISRDELKENVDEFKKSEEASRFIIKSLKRELRFVEREAQKLAARIINSGVDSRIVTKSVMLPGPRAERFSF